MADTFAGIARAVQLRCPSVGILLARQFVGYAFRSLARARNWSWLERRGQFTFPALYNTGTVAITRLSTTVTGTGTTFTAAMVGRQFRLGVGSPIYTIAGYTSATQIDLDLPFGGTTVTASSFQIYSAYLTVPTDFHSFISVVDVNFAWKLWTNVSQANLDLADPQRANAGQPYVVSPTAFDTSTPPLQRMEFWPHVQQQYVLNYLYEADPTDLADSGASLPRSINGDMLLEMALAECAKWPGADTEHPNPYFNLNLALLHERKASQMSQESQVRDDDMSAQDLSYDNGLHFEMAPWPFDAKFLQSHAF